MGFLINNWVELRSDLLKISIEHRRPDPVRTDGIGSWIDSLNFLTWLGSLVTAAIVHLFHDVDKLGDAKTWWTLPITVFVSEHFYLSTRYLVRLALERIGSPELRLKKLHGKLVQVASRHALTTLQSMRTASKHSRTT